MAEKLRVHTLSKALGVESKAILAKCRAEGIELKNHMSTVSAGLEATIREWFSEGAHVTAVETSDPVDLTELRQKKRRVEEPRPPGDEFQAEAPTDMAAAETAPIAVLEMPGAEAAAAEAPSLEPAARFDGALQAERAAASPDEGPRIEVAATAVAGAAEVIPGEHEQLPDETPVDRPAAPPDEVETQAPPAVAAEAPEEPGPPSPLTVEAPAIAEPPKPEREKILPAGPQNVPAPAKLRGPKVVRVEAPEPVGHGGPRSAPRARPGRLAPAAGVSTPDVAPPPAHGRRHGRTKQQQEEDKKRQSASPRRSWRSSDVAGERLKEWRDRDLAEREERLRGATGRAIHTRRAIEKGGRRGKADAKKTEVVVHEPITMREFCSVTGLGLPLLYPKIMNEFKIVPNIAMVLDTMQAQLLAMEFGIELRVVPAKSPLDLIEEEFAERERVHLAKRPPVVTMMGHVDHGKTSLLDALRRTRVVDGEFGGITQHIGAYQLERGSSRVTFLDTPGHAAFTSMRARGAELTDIAVLVIAADDGVMPQTVEAINHAKAANVATVVALNKIDLPSSDRGKVLRQLSENNMIPTEWGGDVDIIETSAATGHGLDTLLEHLVTMGDLADLNADPEVPATGTVIEAKMKEGVGVVATLLVQDGTLRTGDTLVCGPGYGRVRSMTDDRGQRLAAAGPSTPIEVAGLDELPSGGDRFFVVENLQRAKEIATGVKQQLRQSQLAQVSKPKSLEDLLVRQTAGGVPELRVIVKADVQGTLDVIKKVISEIATVEVRLDIIHGGVGGISESDVLLAEASGAIVVGFHVIPEPGVKRLAEERGVEIRSYRVIYNLTDDIRKALEGKLTPDEKMETRGSAVVREVFNITRVGTVAGCYVTEGNVGKNHKVRIVRDSVVVREGCDMDSLKRFKDDASDVRAGMECGIKIAGFDDVKPGDKIEAYEIIKIPRKL